MFESIFSKTDTAKENRLNSVDFLKFVLSVLIIFHHFQQVTQTEYQSFNFFNGKVYFGYLVEFFFLISGYVAALGIDRIRNSGFIGYIKRKMLRIYPMSMISVIGITCIAVVYRLIYGSWLPDTCPGLWKFFNSLLLTFSGGAVAINGIGLNNPIWYLSVLMICYVVLWGVVHISEKRKISYLSLGAMVCLLGIGIHYYNIQLPFLNGTVARGYAAFFEGVLIHGFYPGREKRMTRISYVVLGICLLALLLDFDAFCDDQWGIFTFLLFPSIFVIVLSLGSLFKGRIWSELGKISFEMYLWHSPLLTMLPFFHQGSYVPMPRIAMFYFAFFVTVFGAIMYYFVETPLRKYLTDKFEIL